MLIIGEGYSLRKRRSETISNVRTKVRFNLKLKMYNPSIIKYLSQNDLYLS